MTPLTENVSFDTISPRSRNGTGKIPADWLAKVCAILKERVAGTYAITRRARQDFEELFRELFAEEMLEVLYKVLSAGRYTDARKVFGMKPAGEAYEFLFTFRERRMYGKINLIDGKVLVHVISIHLQQKGDVEHGRFS